MADLVLHDDDPAALLEAIAEGRTAYLNVKKAVRYLTATNLSEILVEAVSVLASLPDPLDPMALLWINLITDVTPAIALGLEPPEPDILERPPFERSAALLGAAEWRQVVVDGAMMGGAALAAFLYGLGRYGESAKARTVAFSALTASQLVHALSARSEAPLTVFGRGHTRVNPWLLGTVAVSLALQAGTVVWPPLRRVLRTAPLSAGDVAIVAAASVAPALAREALKRMRTPVTPR
jgi:Ca2+-transporting ATPase